MSHARMDTTTSFVVAALALVSSGCHRDTQTRKASANATDSPIEMLVTSDAETLDPRYAVDVVGLRATRLVHAGLTQLDPDTLAPRAYVAKSWAWESPLVVRFELREDVRFHSGRLVEARDVVATLEAFASPVVHSNHARVIDAIAGARADGPHAVVVTLKRPHATLLTDLELPILRADEAFASPSPEGRLDGLGPFAVAATERGVVELEPRDGGALPRPLHRVILRTVHDENARALRLLAGRSDIALNAISPTLLPALLREPGLAVATRAGANLTYLLARVDRPPLDDVDLRHAVSTCIDRERITRNLFAGYAHAAHTVLPPGHWAFEDAAPLPFDPSAARACIAQASNGRGLHVSLLTSTDRSRVTIARFVAQELVDAGAAVVDVVPLELGTMIARLNAGDFELAILQLPELAEPNVLRVFLHGSYVPPAGSNRGRVRDPEIDRLLDDGDAVIDRAARRAVYARLEARLRELLPIVPLWHEDEVAITSARARAFVPAAEGRWLSLADLR
jgi:peptide/nickel transport system substrate-binding protein